MEACLYIGKGAGSTGGIGGMGGTGQVLTRGVQSAAVDDERWPNHWQTECHVSHLSYDRPNGFVANECKVHKIWCYADLIAFDANVFNLLMLRVNSVQWVQCLTMRNVAKCCEYIRFSAQVLVSENDRRALKVSGPWNRFVAQTMSTSKSPIQ